MTNNILTRRHLLEIALAGASTLGAACAPSAPSAAAPTSKPAATAPTQAPAATTAPAPKPAAASPAATTAAAPKPAVQAATVPFGVPKWIPIAVSWLIGENQGFFKEHGITLDKKVLTSTSNIIPAMVAGEVWLGFPSVGGTLTAIGKGASLRFIGGGVVPPAFMVLGRKGITSMDQLEGKSVASAAVGSLTYDLLTLVLEKKGLTGKVDRVVIGATEDTLPALIAGKVDAALGDVTFIPIAKREGLGVLANVWEELPNYTTSAYVASTDSIKKHRDELVRSLAGFAKTYRYILQNPTAHDAWIKFATTDQAEAADTAEVEYQWYRENKGFDPDLAITKAQADYMQQLNINAGLQSTSLPFEEVADLSLQKDALALLK